VSTLLSIEGVSSGYGEVAVLREVSLGVTEGSVTALVGSNGAGKSTLMRVLAGLLEVRDGTIRFDGDDITRSPSNERVERGMVLVPEGRMIFPDFSVEENLLIGAFAPRVRARREERLDEIYALFPQLQERRKQAGATLSGGEQQMLALGRGLMARPTLLLLDEPSLGLAPKITRDLFKMIVDVNARGVTIFLTEQDVRSTLAIADHAYVLESGRRVLEGSGAELLDDPEVKRTYLGL
jgi:branched-chain amino acid transport system ATP-binding protein